MLLTASSFETALYLHILAELTIMHKGPSAAGNFIVREEQRFLKAIGLLYN